MLCFNDRLWIFFFIFFGSSFQLNFEWVEQNSKWFFMCVFFIANNHCIISQAKLTRRKLKNKEVFSSIMLIRILHRVIVFSKLSDFWKSFMSCISFFCIFSLSLSVLCSHTNLSFSIRICAVIYGKIQIKWHTNLKKKHFFFVHYSMEQAKQVFVFRLRTIPCQAKQETKLVSIKLGISERH